jgi:hypothetical protein
MCLNVDDLIRIKTTLFEYSNKLTTQKGRGYGTVEDALANLKLVEYMDVMPAALNVFGKITDKVFRLGRILKLGEEYVGFEGLIDTVVDLGNFDFYIPAILYEGSAEFRKKFDKKFPNWREMVVRIE